MLEKWQSYEFYMVYKKHFLAGDGHSYHYFDMCIVNTCSKGTLPWWIMVYESNGEIMKFSNLSDVSIFGCPRRVRLFRGSDDE